ncbi:McrB family protein [Nitrosomonas sp. sh817]|uniref:McrB family protein n=1 Tax=Nitrosomonas sp. sh817 TaxID=3070658 RepID=UPI0027DAB73A|nr:AAA family ATPase [Nitrosomonas sp. sh817]WMJ09681.1 AAA family ATPase [Nitrosomonas sp. sh817]
MSTKIERLNTSITWFVGASFDGTEDQTPRFLAEGVWENGYEDKYLDIVKSMRVGDRIAIKSSYLRKHGLPFDNRGQIVSVMAIKAIGTITENYDDGRHVRVEWTKLEPIREWYFYTNRKTVWRVLPGDWMADGLIDFAFNGKAQDIERFRNDPFWRERFGSSISGKHRFGWIKFYEAVAGKLLIYRSNRSALVAGLEEISGRVEGIGYLLDQYADGTTGFLKDICPFTTIGLFNRGLTETKRIAIARELGRFLGVEEPAPDTFDGIPLLNPQNSWFFPFEKDRKPDQIDALWNVFAAAIKLADSDTDEARDEFVKAFDHANGRPNVAWNLTFGLYWIRPWTFLGLDSDSRAYVTKKLGVSLGLRGPKKRCNASDYLAAMDVLVSRFQEASYPVHSYPELSLEAWHYQEPASEATASDTHDNDEAADDGSEDVTQEAPQSAIPIAPYTIEDILRDGCFLEREEIVHLLDRLRMKKNLILQGPPGTGKTWLAKRLAFALMGQKDDSKVRAVQFHPNLSYEDFVRGWRPSGDGKLSLADGIFMEAIKAVAKNPLSEWVVVIEEINRGNPAQIFGELLTLLEAGKRTPNEALELCYPDADGKRRPIHIPENLYVIGTMNIADRSLALVDLALRRRFAFVNLEPRLGSVWRDWVIKECAIDPALALDIERRMTELNNRIETDPQLGKQFKIGHSYVTPVQRLKAEGTRNWFVQIVETEIGPLLEEYWFDAPEKAREARIRLVQNW